MKNYLLILTSIFILSITIGCSSNDSNYEEYSEENGYADGTYCAKIDYYNPKTSTRNSYTLEVEIEDNNLVTIYWSNGGQLDEDHFSSEYIGEGSCSITSDKGYEYEIEIIGQNCAYTNGSEIQRDIQNDEEAVTCPKCGDEKDEYDDFCYSCKRDIEDEEERVENTCRRCSSYEYGVYGGLCSSCKDDDYGF